MRNPDISFFFLSQLILPPVVLALPVLVLYRELDLLDTHIGMILLYTLTVLPIVIWIMRDQFNAVPIELEEAALVDGASVWVSFFKIVLPIVIPGIASAFILCLILCWNEYFLAALITSTDAKTMPVMVASQISSQSISVDSELRKAILQVPGVGAGSPGDADWQKVGEMCLGGTKERVKEGEFKGVELNFLGLESQ